MNVFIKYVYGWSFPLLYQTCTISQLSIELSRTKPWLDLHFCHFILFWENVHYKQPSTFGDGNFGIFDRTCFSSASSFIWRAWFSLFSSTLILNGPDLGLTDSRDAIPEPFCCCSWIRHLRHGAVSWDLSTRGCELFRRSKLGHHRLGSHNTFVWQPFVVPAESTEIHPRTSPLWGVGGGTGTSGSTGACPVSQTSVDANQCFNVNILNSFNMNSNNKDSVISITKILAPASTTTVTFYSTIAAPCTTFITQIINNKFCTTICNNCEFLMVTAP